MHLFVIIFLIKQLINFKATLILDDVIYITKSLSESNRTTTRPVKCTGETKQNFIKYKGIF